MTRRLLSRAAVSILESSEEPCKMPNLTVEGIGAFPVPENKRLVLALEDERTSINCTPAAATPGARPAGSNSSKANPPE